MRQALIAACLAALPTLAAADPAADFQRLTEAFPNLNFEYGAEAQVNQAQAFVAGMTGTWVELGPLLSDGSGFPDPETLAKFCDRLGFAARPVGSFGFDLEMAGKTMPFRIHLQWAGGTTFSSQYDEAGLLARVFGDKALDVPPDVLFSTLIRTSWMGSLNLVPVGQDLIYLQAPGAPANVLARCPG
jgi:hypothetical protein